MPKRKSEDDYEKLFKKFKKLEKKLRRRCRSRSRSPSEPRDNRYRPESQEQEHNKDNEACIIVRSNVAELLDGSTAPEPEASASRAAEHTAEPAAAAPPAAAAASAGTAAPAPQPSTSAVLTESAPLPSSCDDSESVEAVLDSAILEILGEDPTISNTFGAEIHKDLAIRLEHVATQGLSKEQRKEMTEKYLIPTNCKLVNAPALNAEIRAAISDVNAKRDKNIELRQKQMATAIACLGQVINKLFSNKDADPELIRMIMDTERILCDSQHNDSTIRRNFILSSLKKDMKDQLQNTKPDTFLFGQNLSDTIRAAKAINKSGAELKTPAPKPQTTNKKVPVNSSKNLNWKGPYLARKQYNHPKTKEPPPNRNRPSSSSRPSQQQPTRGRR